MKTPVPLVLLASAAALAGCRKKQPSAEIMMIPAHAESVGTSESAAPSAIPGGGVNVAGVAFTPPAAWKAETPSSPMRAAQYSLPGRQGGGEASLAVYYFGKGQGGTATDNVERWESQFTDAAGRPAAGKIETATAGGMTVTKVTCTGTYSSGTPMGGPSAPQPGSALWGVIVEGPEGNVFLKVTGPEATVAAWTPELDRMLGTLRRSTTSM